jgi:hypothetical protein
MFKRIFKFQEQCLQKPTTRKNLRALKLQEPEMGEGSSPMVARQLEFAPKLVPFINMATKKVFIHPLAFGDTEGNIQTKIAYPR